jgi:hypothetical protein
MIISASLLGLAYATVVSLIGFPVLKKLGISYQRLLLLARVACMTRLFLDICNHQKFMCAEAEQSGVYIYFWPIWNRSFHLDYLFGWSYLTRYLIECVIYMPILLALIIYR